MGRASVKLKEDQQLDTYEKVTAVLGEGGARCQKTRKVRSASRNTVE